MLYPVPDPALHPRRPRSFPFAAFAIAWLAGLLAGCQSTGFGIANLGASASVASIVYAPLVATRARPTTRPAASHPGLHASPTKP